MAKRYAFKVGEFVQARPILEQYIDPSEKLVVVGHEEIFAWDKKNLCVDLSRLVPGYKIASASDPKKRVLMTAYGPALKRWK